MADGKRPSLAVDEREERGSRETRRLRRSGLVPGVLYGASHPDPVAFKVTNLAEANDFLQRPYREGWTL